MDDGKVEGVKGEARVLESLADLVALCSQPIEVQFLVKGEMSVVRGRRLLADEEAELALILAEARPPQVKDEETGKVVYDFSDEKYEKTLKDKQRTARALALWLCYPWLQIGGPGTVGGGAPKREAIGEYLQTHLTDRILETLYAACRGDFEMMDPKLGDNLERRVGFI